MHQQLELKLVEANQHYYHLTQCLLSPSLTLVECKSTNPTSISYEVVSLLRWPVDLLGHTSDLLGPRSPMQRLKAHSWRLFWGPFWPLSLSLSFSCYKRQILHLRVYTFVLDWFTTAWVMETFTYKWLATVLFFATLHTFFGGELSLEW